MRILNIAFALATVGDSAVGGSEQILTQIDRALMAAGHESLVVAAADSCVHGRLFGTPRLPDCITDEFYSFRYTEHKRQICEALNSGPVDLIHMHGFDFYEFIPKVDAPVLATLHLPPLWYPIWIYCNLRPCVYLNCVSLSQRRQVPNSRLVVGTIENGVDISDLVPLPMSQRKGAVILGRICPEKGTHLGIKAARMAGVPLTIAGQVFGYPEHLRYFHDEIEPALNCDVTYVGPVGTRDKTGLLRPAKCLLVPSVARETSSLVAMEALAAGTPVIAMRSGALPEIVEHGRTGLLVGSAEDMSAAIAHVDQIDPAACRETAQKRFNAKRMAQEYIQLYEQLVLRKPVVVSSRDSALGSWNRTAV